MATYTPTRKGTDITFALKTYFSGTLFNNVVQDSELLRFVQTDMNVKVDLTTGGRYIEKAAQIRLGGGVGARTENDYIPEARRPVGGSPRINLRKIQATIEITGELLRLARGDQEAFVDWAAQAMPDAASRLQNELDRQYLGTGSGILAKVVSKGADNVVVGSPMNVAGYSQPWLQFLEGDSIVFTADAAGTTIRNAAGVRFAVVDNLDETTQTIYLKSADGSAVDATLLTAITAGDFIFHGDSTGINAPNAGENREMEGLLAGVDDGTLAPTYHNITRTTTRLFKGNIVDAAAGPLTEALLVTADKVVSRSGGGKITHLVMSAEASIGYWKDQKGGNRFQDARGNFTAGKGNLAIVLGDRTLSFNVARKLPPELCFGLQMDTWERYTPGDGSWDDATGGIFNRATDGTGRLDQYYALYNMHENLHSLAPRKNVRIQNLTPT